MHKRNTLEFLGLWEQINNPGFNPVKFDGIRMEAGLNCSVDAPSTRPKGAAHTSPGQRPGNLKGRPNRRFGPSAASTHTSRSAPEAQPMDRAPQGRKARPQASRRSSRESDPSTTRGSKVRPNGRTVEPGLQPSRICETVTQGVALGWRKDGALPLTKTPIFALNAASTRPKGASKYPQRASIRPKGASHGSPGQRPGNQSPTKFEALKGRSNRCPDPSPAPIHTACSAPETYHMNRAPQAPKARPEESDPSTTRGPKVRPNRRTVEPGLQPSWFCETVTQGVALGWRKDGALPLRKTTIAALDAESAEVRGNIKALL
jgi:hypothetical protein